MTPPLKAPLPPQKDEELVRLTLGGDREAYRTLVERYQNRLLATALDKEHLLVSKALPIFWAPHYLCACSDLSLLGEAYDFSSQAEV